jgi:hypothetical protein
MTRTVVDGIRGPTIKEPIMTSHLTDSAINAIADVHTNPQPTIADRSFEVPTRLYVATVGAYLTFLAILAIGLRSRGLMIPMAIFTVYIMMAFGLPTIWTKMNPKHRSRAMSWGQFSLHGIETATGPVTARDASVQILILPAMILIWGLVGVIVVALV